jgi:predicted DNA-binding transcriptional regulator YafY
MEETVEIVYTNWKGETAKRIIKPIELWYGATEYHPEAQWLLRALDIEKNDERNFAMKDIEGWKAEDETS